MGLWLPSVVLLLCSAGFLALSSAAPANTSASFSFKENFDIMFAEDHFRTSPDGQIWYLYLDKKTGKTCSSPRVFSDLRQPCLSYPHCETWYRLRVPDAAEVPIWVVQHEAEARRGRLRRGRDSILRE